MKSITKLSALALIIGASVASQAQPIDQITGQTLGPNGYASQEFEPANAAFTINAIDDFTLQQGYNFTSIDAGMLIYNAATPAWANVTGWRVEFYSSLAAAGANLTGDAGSRVVGTGGVTTPGGGAAGIVTIPFATLTLGPGQYWVGVMAIMSFGTGGQSGVQESTGGIPAGTNAYQANPGGGFGFGATGYALIGGTAGPNKNLAYRLNGTPVPEPGTFIAIGLGVAGLVAARRRNRK